jgi:hypothetical protein
VHVEWVKAHTGQRDFFSLGNDLADKAANAARLRAPAARFACAPGSTYGDEQYQLFAAAPQAPPPSCEYKEYDVAHKQDSSRQPNAELTLLYNDPLKHMKQLWAQSAALEWRTHVPSASKDDVARVLRMFPDQVAAIVDRLSSASRHPLPLDDPLRSWPRLLDYFVEFAGGVACTGKAMASRLPPDTPDAVVQFVSVCPLCCARVTETVQHVFSCPAVTDPLNTDICRVSRSPAALSLLREAAPMFPLLRINTSTVDGSLRAATATLQNLPQVITKPCGADALPANGHLLLAPERCTVLAARMLARCVRSGSIDPAAQPRAQCAGRCCATPPVSLHRQELGPLCGADAPAPATLHRVHGRPAQPAIAKQRCVSGSLCAPSVQHLVLSAA